MLFSFALAKDVDTPNPFQHPRCTQDYPWNIVYFQGKHICLAPLDNISKAENTKSQQAGILEGQTSPYILEVCWLSTAGYLLVRYINYKI